MNRNLVTLALLLGSTAPAAAQDQLWIRQFGTGTTDVAFSLCPDGVGGAFVAGDTLGNLGGPTSGIEDAWLARYDNAGNRDWVRQFGTSATDYAYALCPDGAGGAFVAGFTGGSLGGTGTGGDDAWLARYDSAGNQTWVRQFGSNLNEYATALCPDGAGGAFVAGRTVGNLGGPSAGGQDAWLARYDSAGNQTWVRQFGTSTTDDASALCTDGAGGAFLAGYTYGSLGGPISGSEDVWLARYDTVGNRIWIRQFGTSTTDYASALCTDGAGGAFLAGYTYGSLSGLSAGVLDAWLARYDGAGNQTWIRQFGTSTTDYASALCTDGAGGAFLAGYTYGSLGGTGVGGDDAWLARYDSAGNQTWIRQLGTNSTDRAYALCPDVAGGAFAAGYTGGALGGSSAGSYDAWLVRYGTPTCYPNCDGSMLAPILNVNDFQCFFNKFAAQDTYANCDHSTNPPALNVNDFQCFLNAFAAGCP